MIHSVPTELRRVGPVSSGAGLAHLPGLDGLRGLAVLAVLAYHADASWMAGGFLGVEMFFTLSGYLVTSLLLAEVGRRGRVDLAAFFQARARRLVPALLVCVLGTLAAYRLLLPDAVPRLRTDALAALGYVQNWHLVLQHVPYAESFDRPSPALHLWSLAVEGQLYLLWPVLLLGGLTLVRRRPLAVLTLALASASAIAMAVLYDAHDSGRAYFGTDTRAAGFLIGAALALCCVPSARRPVHRWRARTYDIGAAIALAVLAVAVSTTSEFADALYREAGFAKTALLTAIVIAAIGCPGTRVSPMLGWAPLAWFGRRSYGIYLYHWPIFVLTPPEIDAPLLVNLARIGATLLVAEASYRWIEIPVRRGAVGRGWAVVRRALPLRPVPVVALSGASLLVAVLMLSSGPIVVPETAAGVSAADSAGPPSTPTPSPLPAPASAPPPGGAPLVVGDSVVLGSADALRAALGPGTTVDAVVSRQFDRGPGIVAGWAAGHDGPIVVHLGSNGIVRPADVDAILAAAGHRRVVLVNVAVPRRWQRPNNAALREAADRHAGRVVLVDWAALVATDPTLLGRDRVHPTGAGRAVLAAAVRAALDAT